MAQEIEILAASAGEEVREDEASLVAAFDPATVNAFVQIGGVLRLFATKLFGGTTGAALTGIATDLNSVRGSIPAIAANYQKLVAKPSSDNPLNVSIDQSMLSQLNPVHSQIMAYLQAFPSGVPMIADTANANYVASNAVTHSVSGYFQKVERGPLAVMPALCDSTNLRMELAISTWPCWFTQSSPQQPLFSHELNLSSLRMADCIAAAAQQLDKHTKVEAITKILNEGGPPMPPATVGYRVVDEGTIVFTKMNPDTPEEARKEAENVAQQFRKQRRTKILGDYQTSLGHWGNASARLAGAGIERALDVGDARTFLRFVNPSTLVMEEPEDGARALGVAGDVPVYRPLPMRDVLLGVLTSSAMRDRHSLLVKDAERRTVLTWFEKAFFREPSPSELTTLMQVVQLFGNNALFGCLAYSNEYEERFGDGIPGPVDRAKATPAPSKE